MAKITQTTNTDNTLDKGIDKSILEKIEERMAKLEEENERLKKASVGEQIKQSKEKYEGPLKFSYKIWGDQPVLSYETFKPDPTKALLYKDGDKYKNNHYLRVKLANGETVEVDAEEFGLNVVKSEKMFATNGIQDITTSNKHLVKTYTFDTKEHGKFKVLKQAIN